MTRDSAAEEKPSVGLAIGTIEVHPRFFFRFDYDDDSLESLAESIRQVGQLQPGRVVPKEDASGYLVYIGVRRFMALKRLYAETGEQRFSKFYAMIDEGLSEGDMFARSIAENMSERGERKELSVLEEVSTFSRFADVMEGSEGAKVQKLLNRDASFVRKRVNLARRIGEQRLRNLYRIERASDFSFTIGHLEYLQRIEDDRTFLLSAAVIAEGRLKPAKSNVAEAVLNQGDTGYAWFNELFPEPKKESEKGASTPPGHEANLPSADILEKVRKKMIQAGLGKEEDDEPSDEGKKVQVSPPQTGAQPAKTMAAESPVPFFEVDVVFLKCPSCGADNPCRLEADEELTFFKPGDGGRMEKDTIVPDTVSSGVHRCRSCDMEFFLAISRRGNGFEAEVSSTPQPARELRTVQSGALSWDPEAGRWVRTVDGVSEEFVTAR